jgi:hypothetical protein
MAANAYRPSGLRPAKFISGAAWNGQTTMHVFHASDATAAFMGDLVQADLTNGGSPAGYKFPGLSAIKRYAAAQTNCRGVVVGFLPEPDFTNDPVASLGRRHRLASTTRWALVSMDPNTLYAVQEADATGAAAGTPLTVTEIGLNADLQTANVAGSTLTGNSGMTLNNATDATTATLPVRIVEFEQKEDNVYGNDFGRWLVKLNTVDLFNTTGL